MFWFVCFIVCFIVVCFIVCFLGGGVQKSECVRVWVRAWCQAGGMPLSPVSVEITYGLERILMALQVLLAILMLTVLIARAVSA